MSLARAAVAGVRWTTLSMVVTLATQIVRLLFLGRLLTPDEFGLMAIMLVVLGLAEQVAQFGLGDALVQREQPTQLERSSLYWLSVCLGLIAFVLICGASAPVAALVSMPEVAKLLPVLATVFLFVPFGNQPRALLQRSLDFRALALSDIVSVVTGAVVAVLLAWRGYGIWSMLLGHLAQCAMSTVLLLAACWRRDMLPRAEFQFDVTRSYLKFGSYVLGSNLLNFANRRIDQLAVGALLGPTALGYYSMAYNLALQPLAKINPVLTKVAYPLLARVQSDPARLRDGYFELMRMLVLVNAPLLLGVSVVAPMLVPLAIGEQWLPAVPVLQVLSVAAIFLSVGNAGGCLVLARGRPDLALRWNALLVVIVPTAVIVGGSLGGLPGVAWALLVSQCVLFVLWYVFVVKGILGPSLGGYLGSVAHAALAGVVQALCVALLLTQIESVPAPARLVAAIVCGAAVYAVWLFVFQRSLVREVLRRLRTPGQTPSA